jgi:hypothetical protein
LPKMRKDHRLMVGATKKSKEKGTQLNGINLSHIFLIEQGLP